MWLKLKNKQYINMATGFMMGVRTDMQPTSPTPNWLVWMNTGLGSPRHTVEEGFRVEKDAQAALDEFMSDKEFVQVSPPVTDDETETDDQSDEDGNA